MERVSGQGNIEYVRGRRKERRVYSKRRTFNTVKVMITIRGPSVLHTDFHLTKTYHPKIRRSYRSYEPSVKNQKINRLGRGLKKWYELRMLN